MHWVTPHLRLTASFLPSSLLQRPPPISGGHPTSPFRILNSKRCARSLRPQCTLSHRRMQLAFEFLGRTEIEFVKQGLNENRTIFESLDLAWSLLRVFPREQLNRIPKKILDEFYSRKASVGSQLKPS
ncbi:hypothetical protein JCM11251_005951 [Rhodosporidiobolus azoricus]